MPHYIIESHHQTIEHRGQALHGAPAENCPGVFLYVLETEANPALWPQSFHSRADPKEPVRCAPEGERTWWLVTRNARGTWPQSDGLRSDGTPIDPGRLPPGYGVIHWP